MGQSIKMALKSIAGNKMRAFLTMLGIIIGVMALVILVSLVNGATNKVTDTISSLGSNLLTVRIKDNKGYPVGLSDLNEWLENEKIARISPATTEVAVGKYGSTNENVTIYGTTASYIDIQGLNLKLGRFLKTTDIENANNVCVISDSVATDIVGFEDCLGEEISLNGMKYTIVGIIEEDEDSLTNIINGSLVAYIPYTSLVKLSSIVSNEITTFYIGAAAGFETTDAEAEINKILLKRFDDEDAFTVSSQNILEDAMSDVTGILTILLGGIAAISLIVGGIGIMNIMLVTVTERTREIGIRKAIGATRGAILLQFLIEAVILCMLGCLIGIFISWLILRGITAVVSSLGLSFTMSGGVVTLAVLFCFAIGVIFGLYPANKAAKMKPIDALHYGG